MQGCECCGQVPGVFSLQSSGVRDGSMTMGFLAKVFLFRTGGNRLFNAGAGLHTAERLRSAKIA